MVLVEPRHSGNVGAAARAMRNFGLDRLVLVAPPAYDPETARWMAPGCADLVARARVVATLDEALDGVHRAIATTGHHRRGGLVVLEPAAAAASVLDEDDGRVTAILFGREDTGLNNDEVGRCDSLLRIPTTDHASLNLAQAVLLVAHALFEESRRRGLRATGEILGGSKGTRTARDLTPSSRRDRLADLRNIEPAADDLVGLLKRVGYLRGTPAEKVRATARTALQRARLSLRHVEALRGMVGRVQWALDHPEIDWESTRRS